MLTDAQWARLSPLLPGLECSPGTTAKDTRLFVEAVLWRARCGVPWRDLPTERFGPWHTVYARFRRWRQAGVWSHVLAQVQNATGLHRLLVDSTAGRAHQVAAGAKKKTAPVGRHLGAAAAA
jgi:transposase